MFGFYKKVKYIVTILSYLALHSPVKSYVVALPRMSVYSAKRIHRNDKNTVLEQNIEGTTQEQPIKIHLRIRPTDHTEYYQLESNTLKFCKYSFTFHEIITSSSQEKIHKLIRPILNDTLSGYNSTIFTYGQTATGKTYTVTGTEEEPGIVPSILRWTENDSICMSVLEIYNEQLRDLLIENTTECSDIDESSISESISLISQDLSIKAQDMPVKSQDTGLNHKINVFYDLNKDMFHSNKPNNIRNVLSSKDHSSRKHVQNGHILTIRETVENGIQVNNLTRIPLQSYQKSMEIYKKALTRRKKDQTQRNKESSRSHCILILWFQTKCGQNESRINIVDLAGSEKIGENDSQKNTTERKSTTKEDMLGNLISSFHTKTKKSVKNKNLETGNINKSLLTLREVIKKLTSQNEHIPYRDSKLTFLLKDSLGGSSKLMVIGTVDFRHKTETLNTLMFLNMIKMIENKPVSVIKKDILNDSPKSLEDIKDLDRRRCKNSKKYKVLSLLRDIQAIITDLKKQMDELLHFIIKHILYSSSDFYQKLDEEFCNILDIE